jgi:photosystem II stability/assembly factor-like uncharacterized protein
MLLAYQFSYSQWELIYPHAPNTTISSFAVSGNTVFAGSTERGVFLSTDKGHTWTNKRIGLDIKPVHVNSIAISGNNVFVATADSGVYRSDNWGDSWEQVIPNLNVKTIAHSSNNLFAGTMGSGIFFSTDNGYMWVQRNNGLTNLNINTMVIEGNNIFIGTDGDGIYYSNNLGENWISKNSGLEIKADSTIFSIDIDGNNVVVGTGYGIFLSTDLGENWIRKYPYGETVAVAFNNNRIYASFQTYPSDVRFSTDMGNTWQSFLKNGLKFQITQSNGLKVGYNIISKSLGFIDNNIVFAGTVFHGICASTNGGEFFEYKALYDLNIRSIVSSGENIFVASYLPNIYQSYAGGIYSSTNMGNSWRDAGFRSESIFSLVLKEDTLFALHYENGIYFSTDLGNSWQVKDATSLSKYSGFKTLIIDGNNWAIATNYYGVLLSTDSGNSWVTKNEVETTINSVTIDGSNIFAGSGDGKGIYLSTNLGDSWVQKGLDKLYIYAIEISGNYVFAGTNDGFYRSTDYGETWELKFRDSLSTATFAFELNEGLLIIGASGNLAENKVFVSSDMGESWTLMNETSERSDTYLSYYMNSITDFAINGEYIYAVVAPSKIFKAKLSNLLPTSVKDESVVKKEFLIFPNPSSNFITIQFQTSEVLKTSEVYRDSDIKIFNTLGECVKTVGTRRAVPLLRIDVSHLPKGVYYLRIGNSTKMFMKV